MIFDLRATNNCMPHLASSESNNFQRTSLDPKSKSTGFSFPPFKVLCFPSHIWLCYQHHVTQGKKAGSTKCHGIFRPPLFESIDVGKEQICREQWIWPVLGRPKGWKLDRTSRSTRRISISANYNYILNLFPCNKGIRRRIRGSPHPKFICIIPQIFINLDPGTTFNPYESWEAEQQQELQAAKALLE